MKNYKEINQLKYLFSCLHGIDVIPSVGSHWIGFKLDGSNRSNTSLFFITRITDKRYFSYGDKVNVQLSVGDLIENFRLPIFYDIFFREEKLYVESLIDNFIYHMDHKNFIDGFGLDGIFREEPTDYGYRSYLRGDKLKRILR